MALRTKESLQRLFEASRLRQEKKKRLQEQKYKNAQESTKKALAKQQSKKQEKTPQIELSRTIAIYNSRYIERFADEDELYQTREELEEAMPHCINWDKWDSLVNKTRKELEK